MLLFVYGTLRRGFNGEMAARLAAESEWIGAGCVPNAQLYQIASRDFDYPALVLLSPAEKQGNGGDKEEPVLGDLFRLLCPEKTLAWLDEYEECGPPNPEPCEYRREEVAVNVLSANNDGKVAGEGVVEDCKQPQQQALGIERVPVIAHTYVWNWPVCDDNGRLVSPVSKRIDSGDWMREVRS